MEILVGVDPGDDTPVVACDGGHATLLRLVAGWHARPGGWTRQGAGWQLRRLFGHVHPTGCATRRSSSRQVDRSVQGHPKGRADLAVRPTRDEPRRMLAAAQHGRTNIIPADRRSPRRDPLLDDGCSWIHIARSDWCKPIDAHHQTVRRHARLLKTPMQTSTSRYRKFASADRPLITRARRRRWILTVV